MTDKTMTLPPAPIPACTYMAPDGVTQWPAYSFEQMQQFARDAITRHLSQPAERGEAVAWMVPSIVSFKGVMRTNCPPEMQAQIEGTVAWHPEMIGDSHPVTDRYGVTYKPRPLVYGDTAPPPAAGVPEVSAEKLDQMAIDAAIARCGFQHPHIEHKFKIPDKRRIMALMYKDGFMAAMLSAIPLPDATP